MTESRRAIIQLNRITKRFPGVVALDDVSLDVRPASCHAVVGENGAGKSTLGKVLAGVYPCDEGQMSVDGRLVRFASPRDGLRAGIGMVHQEMVFCENLSVAENLCLGNLPGRGPWVSHREMARRAASMVAAIDARIDVHRRLGELSVSFQQLVQIAAAVGSGARVLVFDEPTSSLSQAEAQRLFELIRRLQSQGVTVLYISHRLEEVFRLCDTVTVLRDGRLVATRPVADLDEASLVSMMIGRPLQTYFPAHIQTQPGEELLRVERLSSPGKFEDVSFTVRSGEVLGLAGLVGAGRTDVAQAVFGLDRMATGRVYVGGRLVRIRRPADAMRAGLGLIPEDRKRHGLVLSMSARANISLPILERFARLGWVDARAEQRSAQQFVDRLRVRTPSLDALTAGLSGGNQQKLVLARWLAAHCRMLILDEPTRGVDVGAKAEMHALIDQVASEGSGVLLISSDLAEMINLSTRIVVLRRGRVAGEVSHERADQATVMRLMAGLPS